jgi:hypothetical protein
VRISYLQTGHADEREKMATHNGMQDNKTGVLV